MRHDRTIKLRDAIELYQQAIKNDNNEPLVDDLLIDDDWLELTELLSLLKPLVEVSFFVQWSSKDLIHSSLFEALTPIDWLLSKLQRLKKEHVHQPNTHFRACINFGWKLLKKYSLSAMRHPRIERL